jgi:hypothetical protein
MLPLLLAALLGACALFIVLAPLFAPGSAAQSSAGEETTGLVEREALAKQALRDVEFDHQLGNLAEDDYRTLRERYMRRALAAMKGRYDQERTLDDVIETQVRALRDADAAPPATRARRSAGASSAATRSTPDRRAAASGEPPRKRSSGAKRQSGKGGS